MTMSPEAIRALSVAAVTAAVAEGRLTASAVTEAFLAVAAERDPEVQAFAHLDPDRARAEASAAPAGPLAGTVIGVKDVIDTADMPTGYGSKVYDGFRPPADAPVVAIARRLGAVMLGKTVSTEFAMMSPNQTRNPWNPAHTPGGSSSGSAAAVAAGMVHAAFGTQTSGSIIRPSSFCGVVGYKPTFGTLPRYQVKALSESLDTIGVIARSVRDAAAVTAAIAEMPALVPADRPATPRFALFRTSRWEGATAPAREALLRAAATVGAVEAAVPAWFEELYAGHDAVMGWETPRALAYERGVLAAHLSPITVSFIDSLARATRADYDRALDRLADRAGLLDALIGEADVLITLSAPGEAPAGLGATGDPVFNKVWTLLQGPAVTVPAGFGPTGLPLGVQVVGRLGRDAETLAAAAVLEAALAGGAA